MFSQGGHRPQLAGWRPPPSETLRLLQSGRPRPMKRTFVRANASVQLRRVSATRVVRAARSRPVDDPTFIEEESENERTGSPHHCGQHKECRVGSGDVDEPSGCGDADDS